jgi:hypothetical protein
MRFLFLIPLIATAVMIAAWTAPPTATQNEIAIEKRVDALERRILNLEHLNMRH